MFRKRKAQAVLEYIIILAAIVAGLIAARGLVTSQVQQIVQSPIGQAGTVVNSISFLK